MPWRLGFCVLRRIYKHDYETLFHVVIKYHHSKIHQCYMLGYFTAGLLCCIYIFYYFYVESHFPPKREAAFFYFSLRTFVFKFRYLLEVGGNPPHPPDPALVPRVTTNWIWWWFMVLVRKPDEK
jgi:hypothetical protein